METSPFAEDAEKISLPLTENCPSASRLILPSNCISGGKVKDGIGKVLSVVVSKISLAET